DVTDDGHYFIISLLEGAMNVGGGMSEEYMVGPWEAIYIVEEITGLQYADGYDYDSNQYETEPEPLQIYGMFTWVIPT
ncbi:hypothetical protein, partial [Pseudomonas sp. 2995-1]|uniref:hypothetical protein n=1 Tax=Pseudomonas sp. 2995-1 TaxID=1712679 RepID=UPI00130411AD